VAQAGTTRLPPGMPVAEALRLDWARSLRWALCGDPWLPSTWAARRVALEEDRPVLLPQLRGLRTELRRVLGLAPGAAVVLGLAEDAPLGGTLANLYVAAGTLGLAAEAERAVGGPVTPVLCLLPAPDGKRRPLYALGRDGQVHRVSVRPGLGGHGGEQRRAAVELCGALEAVTGRRWALARRALDAAWTRWSGAAPRHGEGGLWAAWSEQLWGAVLAPFGALVLHPGLPPLAGAAERLLPALAAAHHALRRDVLEGMRRLRAVGTAEAPSGPGGAGEEVLVLEGSAGPRPTPLGLLLLVHALVGPAGAVAGEETVAQLVALSGAVEHLEGARPGLRPRPRWTLVGPAESAFARSQGVPVDVGPALLRQARDRSLGTGAGRRVLAGADSLRRTLASLVAELEREAAVHLPRAAGLVAARGMRLLRGADLLAAEVAARLRAEDRARARAWRHLLNVLHPFGGEQDEWLAAYPWLAADGEALLRYLAAQTPGPARRWLRWPPRPPAAPCPVSATPR
jgi:hypothetical protein